MHTFSLEYQVIMTKKPGMSVFYSNIKLALKWIILRIGESIIVYMQFVQKGELLSRYFLMIKNTVDFY